MDVPDASLPVIFGSPLIEGHEHDVHGGLSNPLLVQRRLLELPPEVSFLNQGQAVLKGVVVVDSGR
ncbi:hypothetical protein D1872_353580 [compost metagenome]